MTSDETVVSLGDRHTLRQILISGDTTAALTVDVFLARKSVDSLFDDLIAEWQAAGYYYASLQVLSVAVNRSEVRLSVSLSKGPAVVVRRKVYSGLVRIKPDLIDRYISLDEGSGLKEGDLQKAERSAGAIPFLAFEPPIRIHPLPGYTVADLEFRFREPRPFTIVGGGGYIPEEPSQIVWNLNLGLHSPFGGGREIMVQSERREEGRSLLDFHFSMPVLWYHTGQVALRVATRDYRDEFYEFSLGGSYLVQFAPGFHLGTGVAWKRVEPSTDLSGYSSVTATFNALRDQVDFPGNPKRGYSLSWRIGFTHRRYSYDSTAVSPERRSFNETHTDFQSAWYLPLFSPIVLHTAIGYRGLETGEQSPPSAELFFVGGPGTLRGFRNEQFLVQRAALFTGEGRFRFDQGYLFAFYDAAYLNRKIVSSSDLFITDEQYRNGYGLGIALVERARSVKLSFGWTPESRLDQPRLSVEFKSDL
jgi:outer membrane protein assembly factor BamA